MKILLKLKYLLLIPFIGLVLYALSGAIADGFSHQALSYEIQWVADGGMGEKRDWDAAIGWAKLAVKLAPNNPNYQDMLGRLYFWRFFVADSPVESYAEAQAIANDGLKYLRESARMRPTWPGVWSNILRLKSVSDQIDFEFGRAWDRAIELGDWEPVVQTALLETGLIQWFNFNDTLRSKTLDIFIAMTSKPYSEARAIRVVDRIGAWPLVCDVLVDPILTTNQMRRICSDLRNKPPEPQIFLAPQSS